jgi:hypothetical protein
MPQKLWIPGEEVVADDLNDYLQSQVVAQFPSTAVRDTDWPSPPEDAFCVVGQHLYQWILGQWYEPFSRLARVTDATNHAGIGSGGFDFAATSALPCPGGRYITLKFHVNLTTATASGAYLIGKTGAGTLTIVTSRVAQLNNINGGAVLNGSETVSIASSPTVFRMGIVGIGTTVDVAGAADPSWFEVWDAGPS